MKEAAIAKYIAEMFPAAEVENRFGYTLFFYGGDRKLPFASLASSDNEHDTVSQLDRPGVFRLNIGVSKQTFHSLFGTGPIDAARYDYTIPDQLMPHPHYAAWHFICILNPSERTLESVKQFLAEAYDVAKSRSSGAASATQQNA